MSELVHATSTSRDLRPIGGAPAEHFYWLAQQPYSSYEIVVDATSGDIGPTLELARLAGDGSTVLQSAVGTSAIGFSRSLRVVNDGAAAQASQLIRVRSGACGTGCGPDDVYRIRMRETTGRIPRFNNSASQATIVVLQNTSDGTVAGTIRFWRANGGLAASQAFTPGPARALGRELQRDSRPRGHVRLGDDRARRALRRARRQVGGARARDRVQLRLVARAARPMTGAGRRLASM